MIRKGLAMAIRYNRLWKKLIDENMMKVDLRDQAGITTNALAKLGKNEHVSTQILEKVCNVLHCEIQDIMEFVPDEERKEYAGDTFLVECRGVTPYRQQQCTGNHYKKRYARTERRTVDSSPELDVNNVGRCARIEVKRVCAMAANRLVNS